MLLTRPKLCSWHGGHLAHPGVLTVAEHVRGPSMYGFKCLSKTRFGAANKKLGGATKKNPLNFHFGAANKTFTWALSLLTIPSMGRDCTQHLRPDGRQCVQGRPRRRGNCCRLVYLLGGTWTDGIRGFWCLDHCGLSITHMWARFWGLCRGSNSHQGGEWERGSGGLSFQLQGGGEITLFLFKTGKKSLF